MKRRFMHKQPADVGETYFATDMKTNLPDIVTDTRLWTPARLMFRLSVG